MRFPTLFPCTTMWAFQVHICNSSFNKEFIYYFQTFASVAENKNMLANNFQSQGVSTHPVTFIRNISLTRTTQHVHANSKNSTRHAFVLQLPKQSHDCAYTQSCNYLGSCSTVSQYNIITDVLSACLGNPIGMGLTTTAVNNTVQGSRSVLIQVTTLFRKQVSYYPSDNIVWGSRSVPVPVTTLFRAVGRFL